MPGYSYAHYAVISKRQPSIESYSNVRSYNSTRSSSVMSGVSIVRYVGGVVSFVGSLGAVVSIIESLGVLCLYSSKLRSFCLDLWTYRSCCLDLCKCRASFFIPVIVDARKQAFEWLIRERRFLKNFPTHVMELVLPFVPRPLYIDIPSVSYIISAL